MERLGGAGTGGARSDLKRPTAVQLAPLPQSSTSNPMKFGVLGG